MLSPLGVHAMSIEIASFLPTPRSRANERPRPALPDMLPAAARIAAFTAVPDRWAGLEGRTEAAWVSRALAGDWPDIPGSRAGRARLGVPAESGRLLRPGRTVPTRHGNLRADGVATVLARALAHGRQRADELWFAPGPLPAADELAARYGDAAGLGVHLWPESVRYLWLDRAQRQAGKASATRTSA